MYATAYQMQGEHRLPEPVAIVGREADEVEPIQAEERAWKNEACTEATCVCVCVHAYSFLSKAEFGKVVMYTLHGAACCHTSSSYLSQLCTLLVDHNIPCP